MRPVFLLLLVVDGWLAGTIWTQGATTGAAIPFAILTGVVIWLAYSWACFELRPGRPGQAAYDLALAAGYLPIDSIGDRQLVLQYDGDDDGEDDLLLLETGVDLRVASLSTGRLVDPFTFESEATWKIRSRAGESAVPRSLVSYLRPL